MLQGTSDICDLKECVLKCKEASYFFDFPTEDIFRNLWLYKLGLEHLDRKVWVCDRHFSENMLSSSGKKLEELAVPDQNLPDTLVKKNEIYDQLIKKITTTKTPERKGEKKKVPAQDIKSPLDAIKPEAMSSVSHTSTLDASISSINVPTTTNVSPIRQSTANLPSNSSVNDWLDDSSNLLIDYQLRFQGKHMCDVIEMPQYIVVFTVVKAKELKKAAGNDSVQKNSKENVNPLLSIPSSITVSRTIPKNNSKPADIADINDDDNFMCDNRITGQTEQQPEIDYVYYMTEEAIPRREREVQVDIPNKTRESAVQCDVELDNDIVQMTYGSQIHLKQSCLSTAGINKHECLICGEIVANYASKLKHVSEHKKIRSLCPHCGEVFSNKLKLKIHERDIHSQNELEIKKALRCPKLHCNKAFHSKKQLNNHIDEHLRNTEHKCNKCLRLFPSALKLHCHKNAFKNCLKWRWPKTRGRSRRK